MFVLFALVHLYNYVIAKLGYLDGMTPDTRWVSERSYLSLKGEGRTPPDNPPSIRGHPFKVTPKLLNKCEKQPVSSKSAKPAGYLYP